MFMNLDVQYQNKDSTHFLKKATKFGAATEL
jgi:hypothetical protein